MAVLGLGVLALLVFAALAEAARRGQAMARVGAIVEATILVPMAAFAVLIALLIVSLKCDESCDVGSSEWWHTVDAWQWWGQLVVAVLGLVAVSGASVATLRREYRRATAFLVVAAAAFGAWAAFLAPLGQGLGI